MAKSKPDFGTPANLNERALQARLDTEILLTEEAAIAAFTSSLLRSLARFGRPEATWTADLGRYFAEPHVT